MTAQLKGSVIPKGGADIVRVIFVAMGIAAFLASTLGLLRLGVLYHLFNMILAWVTEATGLDLWYATSVSIALLAVLWFFPWSLLFLPWIGRIKSRVILCVILLIAAFAGMDAVTQNVYFSRLDGRPLKYFALTPEGYKFSTSPGTDPVYGIPYCPVTSEVVADSMRSKYGRARAPETVQPRPLINGPLCPGRYLFYDPRPEGTIEGLQFTITEVDLTEGAMLIRFSVFVPSLTAHTMRVQMISNNGTVIPRNGLRSQPGSLDVGDDRFRSIMGGHGAFIAEFPPLPGHSGETFTIVINDEPLLPVNLRTAGYRPF